MDLALQQIVDMVNDYVGNLINIADMPEQDKDDLKMHLIAAEAIIARNGHAKLQSLVSSVTAAVLSRF